LKASIPKYFRELIKTTIAYIASGSGEKLSLLCATLLGSSRLGVFHSKPEGRTSTIGKNFLSFDEEGMTTHHCCRTAYFTCIYSGKAHEKCACGIPFDAS
jgi:hypothetical protein